MEFIQKDIELDNFEIKQESEERAVMGYASTFGNKDAANDIIEKGAFGKLNPRKIKFLYQHEVKMPIGVIKELREDDKGLYMEAKFSETTLGNDTYTLMKDGAIDKFSVGMILNPKGIRYDEKSGIRYISKAKLMEVSAVTFPANDKAAVTSVKSLDMSKRDFEQSLEMIGFSQKEARLIVGSSYPELQRHWDGDSEKKDNHCDDDLNTKEISQSLDNLLNKIKGN